jgi:hypothetical protein
MVLSEPWVFSEVAFHVWMMTLEISHTKAVTLKGTL